VGAIATDSAEVSRDAKMELIVATILGALEIAVSGESDTPSRRMNEAEILSRITADAGGTRATSLK
jgi:hypothetical protein